MHCLTGQLSLALQPGLSMAKLEQSLDTDPWILARKAVTDKAMRLNFLYAIQSPSITQHDFTHLNLTSSHTCSNATTTLTQLQNGPILISDNFNGKENIFFNEKENDTCVLGYSVSGLWELRETQGPSNTKSGCGWCVLRRICHKHCLHEPTCALWLGG